MRKPLDTLRSYLKTHDLKLTKQRKLSLALEAYRNAIKFDVENTEAWRKFEMMVVRISEEGGC